MFQLRSSHHSGLHDAHLDVVPQVRLPWKDIVLLRRELQTDLCALCRFEQGRRASYFLAANGLGTLIFAPIAFGLSGITNSPIENWKVCLN